MPALKSGLGKKQQAARTRKAIIDAAIPLFSKRGFASTTIQDIARAIGMTTGALYRHFPGKEDVLIAVLAELQKRLATITSLATMPSPKDGRATAHALIEKVAATYERYPHYFLLVGVIAAEATDANPRVERALRSAYSGFREMTVAVLRAGGSQVDDVDCAAEMFIGLCMGGLMHQRLYRRKFPPERALPVIRQMLFGAAFPPG